MLFEKLVNETGDLWCKYINHPLITSIKNDTIVPYKFINYLEQDKIYIESYIQFFKKLAKEASNEREHSYFQMALALEVESDLVNIYEIKTTHPTHVTNQYISYIAKIMAGDNYLAKLIVLAPCIIGYGYIGQKLAKIDVDEDNFCFPWLKVYSDGNYIDGVEEYINIINQYNVSDEQFIELQSIFSKCCQLEIDFFNQGLEVAKPTVVTIAGSDSSGGAGIQADIKAISANGCYAASVITAITAQNTCGVQKVTNVDLLTVKAQIEAIFSDLDVKAVKIGMLQNSDLIKQVAKCLEEVKVPIILDPVMVAKDKTKLIEPAAINDLVRYLFPKALLITPNIDEAQTLLNSSITSVEDMKKACLGLSQLCPGAILLKGGHLKGDILTDVLYVDGEYYLFEQNKLETKHTHGTGCSLSSSIAANIAKGYQLDRACDLAIKYVHAGIVANYQVGNGKSPINHFHGKVDLYE